MAYTEVKERNGKKYYYRVISIRKGKKVSKGRVYLGVDLRGEELFRKEVDADKKLLSDKFNQIDKNIKKIKSKIIPLLKKSKVRKAGIFGSYVKGEQKEDSDIDILIEPPKGIGLGFVRIALELEKALGKKIDLVTYKYLNPHLKKYILKEEVRII